MSVEDELEELCSLHTGLKLFRQSEFLEQQSGATRENIKSVIITGVLAFDASYGNLENINDWFELEMLVPNDYPKSLPIVKEISGKISIDYHHLYPDGSFCLAAPLEVKRIFSKYPSLVGFVDNLVIPFLYSYCYWGIHNKMPFGELSHSGDGIFEYYLERFEVSDKNNLVKELYKIYKHGYRGHHNCPCGSGKIVRKCHKEIVWEVSQHFTQQEFATDLLMMFRSLKNPE